MPPARLTSVRVSPAAEAVASAGPAMIAALALATLAPTATDALDADVVSINRTRTASRAGSGQGQAAETAPAPRARPSTAASGRNFMEGIVPQLAPGRRVDEMAGLPGGCYHQMFHVSQPELRNQARSGGPVAERQQGRRHLNVWHLNPDS